MSTPSCYVCGRWDGSHSGGCPQTGIDYRAFRPIVTPRQPEWVKRAQSRTLPAKVMAI
jgi:hypothetical protein